MARPIKFVWVGDTANHKWQILVFCDEAGGDGFASPRYPQKGEVSTNRPRRQYCLTFGFSQSQFSILISER